MKDAKSKAIKKACDTPADRGARAGKKERKERMYEGKTYDTPAQKSMR